VGEMGMRGEPRGGGGGRKGDLRCRRSEILGGCDGRGSEV
jgi:hypothetical protein